MPPYVLREPHLLFVFVLWCHGNQNPVSCVSVHKIRLCTDLHRAMPIDRLLLQALKVLPLQYVSFTQNCKARALDLCKAMHYHLFKARPSTYKTCLIYIQRCAPHLPIKFYTYQLSRMYAQLCTYKMLIAQISQLYHCNHNILTARGSLLILPVETLTTGFKI